MLKRFYRLNYFGVVINLLVVIHNALPPYKWIHLLGILNFAVLVFMLYFIRNERIRVKQHELRQVRRELQILQLGWHEGVEDLPSNWCIVDTESGATFHQ